MQYQKYRSCGARFRVISLSGDMTRSLITVRISAIMTCGDVRGKLSAWGDRRAHSSRSGRTKCSFDLSKPRSDRRLRMDLRSAKVGDRFPARNSTANFFRFTTCTPSSREARAAFPIALGDLFCSESQYIKLIDQNAAQVSPKNTENGRSNLDWRWRGRSWRFRK